SRCAVRGVGFAGLLSGGGRRRGGGGRGPGAGPRRCPAARGLPHPDGTATETGRALRADIGRRTDEGAAAPWTALGPAGTTRLADLLGAPWLAAIGSGLLPAENTLGIGKV
ncbi:hypothetical protein ACFWVK_02675, partial [Streptomyces sp. NPDC058667]